MSSRKQLKFAVAHDAAPRPERMTVMPSIEHVRVGDQLIAIIVSAAHNPNATEFITSPELNLQVGFVKYPAGGHIQPHTHLPIERNTVGTNEILLVRSGKVRVSLHDDQRRVVAERTLEEGDLLLMVSGGHGFAMVEDTVILEVKQGPYLGVEEKERY